MKRLFYFPFLLILYEFVLVFSNDMYTPAMPSVVDSLLVDYPLVQLTVTAWLAGMAAVALFLCPLFERFGRRRVFLGAGIVFALTNLICSAAHSISFLIVVRLFQGASVCCFIIGGYALIHSMYEHHHSLRVITWMVMVSILGSAIGPVLGGLVLILGTWRMIFGLIFVLGVIVLIPLWLSMPNEMRAAPGKRIYCSRNLKNKRFFAGGATLGSLYTTLFVWITASPFLIIDLLHYKPYQFGLVQGAIFGAFFIGFFLMKPFTKKMNKHQIIHSGLFISFAAVLFLLLWNMYGGKNLVSLAIPMAGVVLGFGVAAEPLYLLTLFSSKLERKEGAVAALYFLLTAIGTVGTFAISVIQETFLSVIGIITIFVSLACLGVFWMESQEQK